MASIEQAPPGQTGATFESSGVSPLNSLLARVYTLNWEAIFYVLLFAAAVLTRFVNLGDRVMSHDESLHTKFSWDLWKIGNFQHTPLMHGPVLFHAIAFSYFLFGDSDFSARLYPAILGIMMVMMPRLLFERWLGKRGAMVASVMLLISPMILYHNRYIREDTPSIFFTMLMLYGVLRYVDGIKPRQSWVLLLLSGATLLGLASKEVAFMYIAIFGAFLTLYWVVQVLAGVRRGEVQPIVGWVVGGILGILGIGGVSFLVGGAIGNALGISRLIFQVGLFLGLSLIGFSFLKPIRNLLGELGDRARTTFQVLTLGIVLGIFASLVMICFVNIIKLSDVFGANAQGGTLLANLVVWVIVLIAICIATVLGTAVASFGGQRRLPWLEMAGIFIVALAVCVVLLFAEERSKFSTGERPTFPYAILVTWVIGVAACAGLIALRLRTTFFQEMKRYPIFDVLVVMGTLVLPWVAALPLWLQGFKLDENYASSDLVINGALATAPFIAVAVIGGICWNWRVWAACAVTFYGIFAFFFTTIFTNPTGIVSGLIGSLGYWLEQQGVRRGSQPQYYYMLVQVPIYEFLPLIGALCAGVAGFLGFLRFRASRYQAAKDWQNELASPIAFELPEPADGQEITEEARLEAQAAAEAERHQGARRALWEAEDISRFPMIGFMAFWAGMITYSMTISGEKMPWLTTHLAMPMILITGWYLGRLLDRVHWPAFFNRAWWLIVITPVLLIAVANVLGPFLFGQSPIGLSREQLLTFGAWLFALLITGAMLYAVWLVMRRIGFRETILIMFLGLFVLLGLLTARTAWRFAYIDYDYATEFGVYAHGAPAMKTVMNKLEELSKATTDGLNIKVAYDNDVSWPGSWYFRNYPNARFLGDVSGATDLDQMAAVLVSYNHKGNVEPQLGDNYYKFDYIRLWWPMQDYFDLNANRVNNVLMTVENGVDPGKLRHGLWDIWWNRDYKSYADATGKSLEVAQWPVADRMLFYVRKDIAAQVWDLGVGNVSPVATTPDPFAKLRCAECRADIAIGSQGSGAAQFNNPHGIEIAPDGKLYVADTRNGRISILEKNGQFIRQVGQPSTTDNNTVAPTGTLREPWDMALAKDGTMFVADTWNHRVQVFGPDGNLIRAWGHFEQVAPNQAGTPDGFWGPRSIALDALGNVYVADTGNKRIRVYDSNGTLLRNIGGVGAAPGQLNEPVGLAVDNNAGRLYVADSWNKRIQVFSLEGNPIANWKVPNWYGPSEDTGNRPFLAVDKTGTRLFAAEPDTGRILVWDVTNLLQPGGAQALLVFGTKGTGDTNRFQAIGGLTVDETSLYVVDAVSNRVLRFALDKLPGLVPLQPVNTGGGLGLPTNAPTDSSTSIVQPTDQGSPQPTVAF